MDHILLIHSFVDGHLGCSHLLEESVYFTSMLVAIVTVSYLDQHLHRVPSILSSWVPP